MLRPTPDRSGRCTGTAKQHGAGLQLAGVFHVRSFTLRHAAGELTDTGQAAIKQTARRGIGALFQCVVSQSVGRRMTLVSAARIVALSPARAASKPPRQAPRGAAGDVRRNASTSLTASSKRLKFIKSSPRGTSASIASGASLSAWS